jgi:YD repeat-containing protein
VTNTFDAGDRLTQAVDSITGTIIRSYDLLDRLTDEQSPQGEVSYLYDNAGRRQSMTVFGQTAVSYSFDNANRLTGITQGTSPTSFSENSGATTTCHSVNSVPWVRDHEAKRLYLGDRSHSLMLGSSAHAITSDRHSKASATIRNSLEGFSGKDHRFLNSLVPLIRIMSPQVQGILRAQQISPIIWRLVGGEGATVLEFKGFALSDRPPKGV